MGGIAAKGATNGGIYGARADGRVSSPSGSDTLGDLDLCRCVGPAIRETDHLAGRNARNPPDLVLTSRSATLCRCSSSAIGGVDGVDPLVQHPDHAVVDLRLSHAVDVNAEAGSHPLRDPLSDGADRFLRDETVHPPAAAALLAPRVASSANDMKQPSPEGAHRGRRRRTLRGGGGPRSPSTGAGTALADGVVAHDDALAFLP